MVKFEELLQDTEFTIAEWQAYEKVLRHNHLEDLQITLNEMLDNEQITQEQYNDALDNADYIIENYGEHLSEDWQSTMKNAINLVIE